MRGIACSILVLLLAAPLSAHIRVSPVESRLAAAETYVVRVPTEREVATTSVRVMIPDDVVVESAAPPAEGKVELVRAGDRVTAIEWTVTIAPRTTAELTFVAQNPAHGQQLVWNAVQRYSDSTQSEWTGAPDSRTPAPSTRLR